MVNKLNNFSVRIRYPLEIFMYQNYRTTISINLLCRSDVFLSFVSSGDVDVVHHEKNPCHHHNCCTGDVEP